MDSFSNRNYDYGSERHRSISPSYSSSSASKSYYQQSQYNDYVTEDQNSRSPQDWRHDHEEYDKKERSAEHSGRNYRDYRPSSRDRDSDSVRSRDRNYDKARDRDFEHRSHNRDRDYGFRDRNSRDDSDYSGGYGDNDHLKDRDSRGSERSGYSSQKDFDQEREGRRDRDKSSSDWDRDSKGKRKKDRSYDRSRDRSRHHSNDRDKRRDGDRRRDSDFRRDYCRDSDKDSDRSYHDEELIDRTEDVNFENQTPNYTIMLRGLAQHITENDILQDIVLSGLSPKDIRLIRKRDTGTSRGFAFVEFTTVQEAIQWMNMKQGVLMLQDQYRAVMLYSISKEQRSANAPVSDKSLTSCKFDWVCIKCAACNFRRRGSCYKCQMPRIESEVSLYPTKTIMLRNLDALSTEDSVMAVLKTVVGDMVKNINGVLIGRDPLTQTSRGICYLDLETTVEALSLFAALNALNPPLTIDGKKVNASYCKYRMGDLTQIFPQVALDFTNQAQMYSLNDLNTLADYSASRYAKTPEQYQHYFEYYKKYFEQQINQGTTISLAHDSQVNSANAAAAVAQMAIQQRQGKLSASSTVGSAMTSIPPTGIDGKQYPTPDASLYQYDESTGYYYDSSTGLYYDANTQYYYNSVIQKYLYWDSTKMTYQLAPTAETAATSSQSAVTAEASSTVVKQNDTTVDSQNSTGKKKKSEKTDKAKMAKQIAKDMERWAKNMNKNKETVRGVAGPDSTNVNSLSIPSVGSADIGFAVLEKKAAIAPNPPTMTSQLKSLEMNLAQSQNSTLVAAYGGGSDTSGDEEATVDGLVEGLDWENFVCLLCKRKFTSKEAVAKHQKVSDLHRTNLEQYCAVNGIARGQTMKYRDRAKERREKFGEADIPPPSKLKEKYLKARETIEPVVSNTPIAPIGGDNVGNKLLQKMGWSEGQGLGRSNQGRTTIIEAEKRITNAGLGAKSNAYTSMPGDTYKDCVKKMMYARYQELSDT